MSHLNPFDTPFDGSDELDGDHANPQRLTQWPSIPDFPAPPIPTSAPSSGRKSTRRQSLQKPSPIRKKSRARQREQNAKAGIKVITNFSRHPGTPQVRPQPAQATAPRQAAEPSEFADPTALQSLQPNPSNNKGFWNVFWSSNKRPGEAPRQAIDSIEAGTARGLGPWSAHPHSQTLLNLENDLSPNDRPIMIGLTVPHDSPALQGPSTAGTEASIIRAYGQPSPHQYMPGTPDIVVTPAAPEVSYWSPDTASANTPHSRRIPSSIYSRPAASPYYASETPPFNAPPVPRIPQSVLDARNRRESVDTIFDDDDETPITFRNKVRNTAGTMFEEDQSPILTRTKRVSSLRNRLKVKTTLLPNENRQSFGWWNTIVSPFIPTPRVPRSSTFISPGATKEERPPLPGLQMPATQTTPAEKPISPLSATTIASEAWWDNNNKTLDNKFDWEEAARNEKDGKYSHKTKESVSTQNGTLPFMLGDTLQNELGLAAEAAARQQREQQNNQQNSQQEQSSLSPVPTRQGPVTYPTYQTTTPPQAYSAYHQPAATSTPARMPPTSGGPLHLQLATMSSQTSQSAAPSFDVRSNSITPSVAPPPYTRTPATPRVRAIYPPGHAATLQQPVSSPGPVPPGLQQAMTSTGAIAMEDVPLTPAPEEPRRVINLNSGYPTTLPQRRAPAGIVDPVDLTRESERKRKIEEKRRRHEREDEIVHKAGGLWRGRGCVSKRGCYGRGGAEGRRRRRCWLGGCGVFGFLIVLAVVLVTQLRKSPNVPQAISSPWVNLTAFPPMVTGVSTVATPENVNENTGCTYPKTVWSCSLPKELHSSVAPAKPNQPNFKWLIQWDNSSASNATWGGPSTPAEVQKVGNPVSARALMRRLILGARSEIFTSNPPASDGKEIAFLSNTTDGIKSDNFSGEPTPFYISLLDATSNSTALPPIAVLSPANATTGFPAPEVDADGTAALTNLLPTARQQPLRLFDRGLPTEHYGFYTYYTRSIFLKSTALLDKNDLGDGEVLDDRNGGCTKEAANVRCSWSETRLLVQIWTNRGKAARLLGSGTSPEGKNEMELASNFTQPGTFPYPVTVKLDRHGGDPAKKGVYCYKLDERSRPVRGSARLRVEYREFGGTRINKAPGRLTDEGTDYTLGGFDGGTGGCKCEWKNFVGVV